LIILILILLNYLSHSFCNEKELYLEYINPYEITIKKLEINDFSFSNRPYKIREVPKELLGLNRLYFPGGARDYFKIMTDKPVRIYAVFNYNPNWSFTEGIFPEDKGWFLYKRDGYGGDSNSGKADIYFKDFNTGLIELKVPKWWICLGIEELDAKLIDKNNINIPVRCISHAGYPIPEPNTLESIEKAISLGFFGIEIDVQVTKDNIPILLHNNNLLAEAGVDLNCTDLLLQELQQFKRKGSYKIPTLDEVINYLENKKINLLLIDTTHIPIDRKQNAIYEIEKLITKYNAYDLAVIQINKSNQINFIDLDKYKISWNTYDKLQNDSRIKCYTINPLYASQKHIDKDIISILHENKSEAIGVNIYPETYLATLQSGCDYIIVSNMEKFKKFCIIYKIPLWGNKQ